jgi:hypothetical protein
MNYNVDDGEKRKLGVDQMAKWRRKSACARQASKRRKPSGELGSRLKGERQAQAAFVIRGNPGACCADRHRNAYRRVAA